ncbi:MAG TPA: dienelactone hydrolase family protein [Thermoanaerobaculia bacterium]|nr:dienelactone hydrolase family protein [Thermoanaerobaculia bacterium]
MSKSSAVFALTLLLSSSSVVAQVDPHAGHAHAAPATTAQAAAPLPPNEAIPPDAEGAKAALAKSPRHGEWVDLKLADGTKLLTWVVYPESKAKAGVVLVIHEIYGLTDWVRGVADQLAEDGFIALAPDLLSGLGPNGGGTEALGADVGKTIRTLTPEQVTARLDVVRDYALKLPAANGKSASVGYCWGGSMSFAYAAAQPKLDGAVVYYGSSPADAAAYSKIVAPILGLYGADDARVNATIPTAEAEMKKLGKPFTAHLYEGAGHGFLRQQAGRDGANRRGAEKAWATTLAFLRERLK